jgi:hypothetical protein
MAEKEGSDSIGDSTHTTRNSTNKTTNQLQSEKSKTNSQITEILRQENKGKEIWQRHGYVTEICERRCGGEGTS